MDRGVHRWTSGFPVQSEVENWKIGTILSRSTGKFPFGSG